MRIHSVRRHLSRPILSTGLTLHVLVSGIGCRGSSEPAKRTVDENMACAMAYVAAPDQVVMARNRNNPRSDEYVLMPDRFRLGKASVRKAPSCWVQLAKEVEQRDVPAWTPVIFMHGRRAPAGGDDRLVVLEIESRFTGDGFFSPGPELHVVARVLGRDSQGRPVVLHMNDRALNLGSLQYSTIYAGQPDPGDPSHFTIRYEVEGYRKVFRGRVDGWLQSDDSVRLTKTF